MRDVIFRGKIYDDKYGAWAEGFLSSEDHINVYENYQWTEYDVDPETVGQYTGLTDKNGKRIFEGDIVKWDARGVEDEYIESVEWDYTLFDQHKYAWNTRCEIIGNIHDNPELLKSATSAPARLASAE